MKTLTIIVVACVAIFIQPTVKSAVNEIKPINNVHWAITDEVYDYRDMFSADYSVELLTKDYILVMDESTGKLWRVDPEYLNEFFLADNE